MAKVPGEDSAAPVLSNDEPTTPLRPMTQPDAAIAVDGTR